MKKGNFTLYRLLAAACFALRAAYEIYLSLGYGFDMLIMDDYIYIGVYVSIALTLLLEKKVPLICASILFSLYGLYNWFLDLYEEMVENSHSHYLLHTAGLFWILAFAAFAVILIMAAKSDKRICSFWFLPATFCLVSTAAFIYLYDYFFPVQYGMEMQWLLPEILRDAIEACGFAFAGLWLKGGVSRSTNTSVDAVSATDTGASLLTDSKQ